MKRRVRKIANFFAFNLLFFALYLNFIHKDKLDQPITPARTAAFSGTVREANPQSVNTPAQEPGISQSKDLTGAPLKLSIN